MCSSGQGSGRKDGTRRTLQCLLGTPYLLHALGCLPGDVDQLEHLELGLLDMQVFVEAATLTPLCHDRQVVLGHVAHEEQDVHVPRFAGGGKEQKKGSSQLGAQGQYVDRCDAVRSVQSMAGVSNGQHFVALP